MVSRRAARKAGGAAGAGAAGRNGAGLPRDIISFHSEQSTIDGIRIAIEQINRSLLTSEGANSMKECWL